MLINERDSLEQVISRRQYVLDQLTNQEVYREEAGERLSINQMFPRDYLGDRKDEIKKVSIGVEMEIS